MEKIHQIESDERLSDQPGAEGFRNYLLEYHQMSGAVVLQILDENREIAEILKNKLPAEQALVFGKLLSARKFIDSPQFTELVEYLNKIQEINEKTTQFHKEKFGKPIIETIKQEYGQFLTGGSETIDHRLRNTEIVFLDLFRFYALVASKDLSVDLGGVYYDRDDVILLAPWPPVNETLRMMWEANADFQHAYLATTTTHELLHATSQKSFLLIGEEQEGKSSLKLIDQKPNRAGVSTVDEHGHFDLVWLNEGITALLTARVSSKIVTGDEEFDGLIQEMLKRVYSSEQSITKEMLKVIPEEILFGAYFNKGKWEELNVACREKWGLDLKELDKVAKQDPSLKKLKKIIKG